MDICGCYVHKISLFVFREKIWLRESELPARFLIKEHIITSLSIEPSDLDLTPFDRHGGLSAFYNAFGDDYEKILEEMSEELVA